MAIETASSVCGVALMDGEEVLAFREEVLEREHAEKLPHFCEAVLEESNTNISDLAAIAVSIGPGSFTGLRIGLSFAKGIAFSSDLSLVPVPTLLAMTENCELESGDVATVLFSHKNYVYHQNYFLGANRLESQSPALSATWKEVVAQLPEGIQLVHYGCHQLFDGPIDGVTVYQGIPSAKAVGRIAADRYSELAVKLFHALEPNYIASFQIGGKPAS
ncbi:MAG: tRNA (adenosine(37)-N6)-threonylcarbamoyltransferase complex dimerization subunit type 1 TsaB [Dehalococcoidia bacterium]|nr:tRNA (adenosine(37)-N6)-threonylcarbamoyltransferase complex dimerization subunit type 1 TsaB [Dehalococcoidia bacterium]